MRPCPRPHNSCTFTSQSKIFRQKGHFEVVERLMKTSLADLTIFLKTLHTAREDNRLFMSMSQLFLEKKKEKNRKIHSKKIDLAVLSLQKINANFRNLDDAASYAHIRILLFVLTGFSVINDQVFSRELIIENANQSFWPV